MTPTEKAFSELFESADKIRHWHDSLEGMTVSKRSVFELWETLNKHRQLNEKIKKAEKK